MPQFASGEILDKSTRIVADIACKIAILARENLNRESLFSLLAAEIMNVYPCDRFSIYLYDAEREFLHSFKNVDGSGADIFSETRIAHNTLAWQAIQTRKPLVVKDLPAIACGYGARSLVSAGLNASVVVPIIFNKDVIGTIHLSFINTPEKLPELLTFVTSLEPHLATSMFVIMAQEKSARAEAVKAATEKVVICETNDNKVGIVPDFLLETGEMSEVMSLARKVAKLNIPILLLGETGTGKSMLAHWLHRKSSRKAENFIKVNCPSLVPTLFESEMFGFSKGAFTGAFAKRIGRIELAQHGTLFLDEIGELSTEIQSKLLQVLEDNSFERVGEARAINVDVRVISATNIEIERALDEGFLRRDLYYRLAPVVLHLPPLRKRLGDIQILAQYFLDQFAKTWNISAPKLSKNVIRLLRMHDWPGNIRELRNVISRILLKSLDSLITDNLVEEILYLQQTRTEKIERPFQAEPDKKQEKNNFCESEISTLEQNEREHIMRALRATGGRVSGPHGAASILGIHRSTLQHRMRKLGINF